MASINRRRFLKATGIAILPAVIPPATTLSAWYCTKKTLPAATKSGGSTLADSTGSIAFINMSSSFVTSHAAFTTGQLLCDKIANFFTANHSKVFDYLTTNPSKILPGDSAPETQWSPAVIHYICNLLAYAKGCTEFNVSGEIYSQTQSVESFSSDIIKTVFDTSDLPESVTADAALFMQGIANTLRSNWQDKRRPYNIHVLAICHEAIPTDNSGNSFEYLPKIKYYTISIDESQTEFTTPCEKEKPVSFNFKYAYYVSQLRPEVLNNTSQEHNDFINLLNNGQAVDYKTAENYFHTVLDTASFRMRIPVN